MHIMEGALSLPVLIAGTAAAAAGVGVGLWKMDYDRVPRVAVVSSAFFVASFIHIPVPPTSVHLVFSGLAGVMLGWAVFPAVLVGLLLQKLLFDFGGYTTLGVNTWIMATPGLCCYYLFHRLLLNRRSTVAMTAAFAAGALAIVLALIFLWAALVLSGQEFREAATTTAYAHLPLVAIEGLVTAATVGFLRRVRPELLKAPILELSDDE